MNILVIGSGGREHALIWKLKQSSKVSTIFAAPGNAGTAHLAQNVELTTADEILTWLTKYPVDLVIVGPDAYLAEGVVDRIQKLHIPVFGPTVKAAEIEWSKSYAKQFMIEESIPTAKFKICTSYEEAKEYVKHQMFPLVIKASGLALGKGVIIAQTLEEAEVALQDIMSTQIFGDAGKEVVIEEFLSGREISIHAFCDGENAVLFPAAEDHKRIFNNDEGPNTGGMGTIAPVLWVDKELLEKIKEQVVLPTLRGLKKRGRPFVGILFPGIMVTQDGIKVIEFNARFGDPETQSYMRLLKTDLLDCIFACINGTLNSLEIEWSTKSACCIMLASQGYPGTYEKGKEIKGIENMTDDIVIFHSGTKIEDNKLLTNGGRVLGVSAIGEDIEQALNTAYAAINDIKFEGMQYRTDIGFKSLKKF